jgi:cyclase
VAAVEELIIRSGVGVLHGRVNAGFVAGSESAVVIDTMNSPADGREIAAFMRRHTAAPVMAVLNTHHHADHTWGNQVFGAPVIATETCRQVMAENLTNEWTEARLAEWRRTIGEDRLQGLRITLPSVTFARGVNLHLGRCPDGRPARVEALATGGHAPGHSMALLPEHGVLFTGDLFFVGRYPFARQAHTPTWIAALERVKKIAPAVLVPGHGPVCDGARAIAEADRHIAYLQESREQVDRLLDQGLDREAILARADEFPRYPGDGYERLHRPNLAAFISEAEAARRTGGQQGQ